MKTAIIRPAKPWKCAMTEMLNNMMDTYIAIITLCIEICEGMMFAVIRPAKPKKRAVG